MIRIHDKFINASMFEVLRELRRQLKAGESPLLEKVVQSGDSVQICCPFHKFGTERRPSMGVLANNKGNIRAGTAHCFTCGKKSNLISIINYCFGKPEINAFGRRWLFQNFAAISIHERELQLDLERSKPAKQEKYVSEKELDSYRYYHDYMIKRKLTKEIVEKFDVGFDSKTNCLTFPVRDKTGGTLFIARRSVKEKYFNYPKGVEKPLYGVYELGKNKYTSIIVCESIINALTCWIYGMPAVALNGAQFSKKQLKQLRELNCRNIILGLDPDEAGRVAAEKLKKLLHNYKMVQEFEIPEGCDINDLTLEEFKKLPLKW